MPVVDLVLATGYFPIYLRSYISFMKNYLFFLLLVSCFTTALNAQDIAQVDYTPTDAVIGNPERGFYHQVNHISAESLQEFKANGIRLVLINYSLKGLHNKPIPSDFLNNLEADFEKIRQAGFKMIVRFAYSFNGTDPIADAPLEFVLLHIEQLGPILRRNSDVILTLQAGFIGTWGEWWNTENFSEYPGSINEENWADRRMVMDALLEVMPEDRMIQLRTPLYKKNILQESSYIPVEEAQAYNGSVRSRVAHHNDCFVSGNFDLGTYHDTLVEKPYLALDSKYTIVGGETCNPNAEASCENSLKELERFHWSFLNLDYHQGILSQWGTDGCYDEIERRLGYRYQLLDADLQSEAKPGGQVLFNIRLKNEGWANPTNAYALKLILRNTVTQSEYILDVAEDLRKWPIRGMIDFNVQAGLPLDMDAGAYELFLAMKDGRISLGFNPDYAIQLANEDTWEPATGYNNLHHTLSVSANNSFPDYTGTAFFHKDGYITPGFEGPKAIKITQYNDNNIIYWSMGQEESVEKVVRLQRSENGAPYQTLAIKPLDEIFYTDKGLADNTSYAYRVQFIRGDEYSAFTEETVIKQNPATRAFIHIELDGLDDDWDIAPPVTTGFLAGMAALKLSNDVNNLYCYMEAPVIDNYQLLLNTDDGNRYVLRNDSLFHEEDTQLIFKQTLVVNQSNGLIETFIPLADIDFLGASLTGELELNGEFIGLTNRPFSYLKNPVLSVPENFKVVPSVTTPLTKVKVSWLYNSQVEGYVIERSIGDADHFEVIKELSGSNNYWLNNDLDSATKYFYRMFSYSGIVRSAYTQNIDIQLNIYDAVEDAVRALNNLQIFPNPAVDEFTLRLDTHENLPINVAIYNSNLTFVKSIYHGNVNSHNPITIQRNGLEAGLYFLKIQSDHLSVIRKILIL